MEFIIKILIALIGGVFIFYSGYFYAMKQGVEAEIEVAKEQILKTKIEIGFLVFNELFRGRKK